MSTFHGTNSILRSADQSTFSMPGKESERTALESSSERIQQTVQQVNLDVRNATRRELICPIVGRGEHLLRVNESMQFEAPEEKLLQRIFEEDEVPTTSHEKFRGTVYILTKDEGGLRKPFFTGTTSELHFRINRVMGKVTLPIETKKMIPGEASELDVELLGPFAIEKGMRFAILERNRTIAVGTVVEIIK